MKETIRTKKSIKIIIDFHRHLNYSNQVKVQRNRKRKIQNNKVEDRVRQYKMIKENQKDLSQRSLMTQEKVFLNLRLVSLILLTYMNLISLRLVEITIFLPNNLKELN
jgi:hypothetical protein